MKKLLILVMIVSVFVLPLAGCLAEVKTYTDSGQTIAIGINQEFIVALGSIPTTGYGWYVSYDETVIELVARTYEPGEQAKRGVVSAGGVDFFRFKALKRGEVRITMTYQRAWEEGVVDQKLFTINIK